jgi:hypothetical protein
MAVHKSKSSKTYKKCMSAMRKALVKRSKSLIVKRVCKKRGSKKLQQLVKSIQHQVLVKRSKKSKRGSKRSSKRVSKKSRKLRASKKSKALKKYISKVIQSARKLKKSAGKKVRKSKSKSKARKSKRQSKVRRSKRALTAYQKFVKANIAKMSHLKPTDRMKAVGAAWKRSSKH